MKFSIILIFIFCACVVVSVASTKATDGARVELSADERLRFRRQAFEEATLNYIEANLSCFDTEFDALTAFRRCEDLLRIDYIEFSERSKIIHSRLLLRKFDEEKDEKLLLLLKDISDSVGISLPKVNELDNLVNDIEVHIRKCMSMKCGTPQTISGLKQFVNNINSLKGQLEEIHRQRTMLQIKKSDIVQ